MHGIPVPGDRRRRVMMQLDVQLIKILARYNGHGARWQPNFLQ